MKPSRTYLPVFPDYVARELFLSPWVVEGQSEQPLYPYERLGLDRLLAIVMDLSQRGVHRGARFLDFGASSGLFSQALASRGYVVTAVENNLASQVQKHYPAMPSEFLRDRAAVTRDALMTVVEGDGLEVVAAEQQGWDVCLLLSVVHQMATGYALTPSGKVPLARLEEGLRRLVQLVKVGIYYEFPVGEEAGERMQGIATPEWFVENAGVRWFEQISASPSADGDSRPLYFLSTKP